MIDLYESDDVGQSNVYNAYMCVQRPCFDESRMTKVGVYAKGLSAEKGRANRRKLRLVAKCHLAPMPGVRNTKHFLGQQTSGLDTGQLKMKCDKPRNVKYFQSV